MWHKDCFMKYSYDQKSLTEDEWHYFEDQHSRLICTDEYDLREALQYPGLIFDAKTEENKRKCDSATCFTAFYVQMHCNTGEKMLQPHGNLGTKHTYAGIPVIVLGRMPEYTADDRGQPVFLLGEKTKLLHNMLNALNIFPYFTTIYKKDFVFSEHDRAECKVFVRQSLDNIAWEIENVRDIVTSFPKYKVFVITLGEHKEYDVLFKWISSNFIRIKSDELEELIKNGKAAVIENIKKIKSQMHDNI